MRYSPSFTAEEPETCRCSTLCSVSLQAVPSASQKVCLQLCWAHWKCKNVWAGVIAPESPSPPPRTAPKMSLVAQEQQWKIQHLIRAQTNAETLMSLATIKHSPCQGLQAWSGRSPWLGESSHTFTTETIIFTLQKL